MNPNQLMSLLQEAAHTQCSVVRRAEIVCELGRASARMGSDGVYADEGEERDDAVIVHTLLERLYSATLDHNPALLPSLFPVFSLICVGRQQGAVLSNEIAWEAMT